MQIRIVLADTPWTFPFVLGWMLLSVVAPIVLVATIVLASLQATRRIGVRMLLAGIARAVFGCLGDLALMLWVSERFSQTTAIGWLFAAGGGFALFSISVGAFAATLWHTRV